MTKKESVDAAAMHLMVSQRVRDWFQGAKQNHGWQKSNQIASEIDAMIAAMEEPLPETAAAWKRWNDFENDTNKHDPCLYMAMDLCKHVEWCADVALGLTAEPFEGVPRLTISFS